MEKRPNFIAIGAPLPRDRVGERFGGMLGAAAGEVLDLLTARDARRDDERVRVRRLHGGRQAAVAAGGGDGVVRPPEPPPTRPAPAARTPLPHLPARPPVPPHPPP